MSPWETLLVLSVAVLIIIISRILTAGMLREVLIKLLQKEKGNLGRLSGRSNKKI